MALPPKGDPRRPLFLAARSMRLLGIILLLISTCAMFPFLMNVGRGFGTMSWASIIFVGVIAIYAIPGTCYFIFPIFFLQRKYWAVVASIVLVSIHALLALVGLVALLFEISSDARASREMLIPVALILLMIAALAQLIWHLSLSFEAIRNIPAGERGFEPILPLQILPMPTASAPPPEQPPR